MKFEQNYLIATAGQEGPLAGERRAIRQANIRYQITNLKEPAEQVKALNVAATTAEKKLVAAGEVLDAAHVDLPAAQNATTTAQEDVETQYTHLADVK